MTPEVAQQVVIGITALGVVVWLCALSLLVQSARRVHTAREGADGASTRRLLAGSAEIAGEPAALASKAAAVLAKGTLGPLKIVDKTDERVVFERLDPGIANQPAGRWFRWGEIRFSGLRQNRTQVEWIVEPAALQWLLWVGGFVQTLGLVGLVVGCWFMVTHVATAAAPAIRWQSLQMLQVVHLLWPPFLCAGLYRRGIRSVATEFEALANNLPYLGE